MKSLKSLAIFVLLFSAVQSCSYAQKQKPESKEQEDVQSLYQTVKNFSDTWYKERDEDKFWNFLTADSRLREFRKTHNPFRVPFEGEPEGMLEKAKPETLKIEGISRENLEKIQKENIKPLPLNPDTVGEMVILKSDDEFLKKAFRLSDKELADAKKEKVFPSQEFFFVLYGVRGDGYYKHGLVSFWVKEGAGWKLFNFIMVQR
ncbi:MAG: hypothetical protein HYT63_03970 [Candidatus Yanofskybacteria bacterium]|nr:hypothetical protein [Candidatus Yanofskybacteria bacterium]